MITRDVLTGFLTIVKMGSIKKAADALFITQPSLSRKIRSLEEELGYPLFRRHKGVRTIEMTKEGIAFLSLAEQWHVMWEKARKAVDEPLVQPLRVAAMGSLNYDFLISCYFDFLDANPQTGIELSNQHPLDAYPLVESGAMDLAFVAQPLFSKTVKVFPLFKEPFVLISNGNYPETVQPDTLDPRDEVRFTWTAECEAWRSYWFGDKTSRVLMNDIKLLASFLERGGWALVPRSAAEGIKREKKLMEHTLLDPPPDRQIYYILKQDMIENPQIKSFLHIVDIHRRRWNIDVP